MKSVLRWNIPYDDDMYIFLFYLTSLYHHKCVTLLGDGGGVGVKSKSQDGPALDGLSTIPLSDSSSTCCIDLSCRLAACTRKCRRDSREYPLKSFLENTRYFNFESITNARWQHGLTVYEWTITNVYVFSGDDRVAVQ